MNARRRYEVVVVGHECADMGDRFDGLDLAAVNGDTAIGGERLDAAMLRGVLLEVERLGLELRAVRSHLAPGE